MKKINSNMRVAELDTLSDVLIRMYKDSSAAENALSKDTNLSLIMAEVEFPDEATANAYIPEDWFLLDVTLDKRYHNSNMSKHGLPC